MSHPLDETYLLRAIELGARGGRGTAPNPRVGAVLVQDGLVIGEGWHRRAGEAHAEIIALEEAGSKARGATLFTTLEPCPHYGQQPPCVDRILGAGVRRVVVGLVDPDSRVAGQGIEKLRSQGVEVELCGGEAGRKAEQLIEDYLVHRRLGRAFAALKIAATLDGKIADRNGTSRWITGDLARAHGRNLRNWYGAILVGAGTVLADDPLLLPDTLQPAVPRFLRCVVDHHLDTPPTARLFREVTDNPVLIFTTSRAPSGKARALREAGAEIIVKEENQGVIPPRLLLEELGRRGILGVLVEGGGVTHGWFLESGVADKIHWYQAPLILGDPQGIPALITPGKLLSEARRWRIADHVRLGDDLHLTLYPDRIEPCSPDS